MRKWLEKIFGVKELVERNYSYQVIGKQLVGIDDNPRSYIKAYKGNDLIYSVLNLISDKVKVPSWEVFKVKNESSLKRLVSLMNKKDLSPEDLIKVKQLKEESLERVETETPLSRLLKYANEEECFNDFVANGSLFKLLTGNRFVYANILDAGANAGQVYELFNLPSQDISIVAGKQIDKPIIRVLGYKFNQTGFTDIPKQFMLHDRFFNPDWDVEGQHFFGQSPLRAAIQRITRSNAAIKAQAAQFENQGIQGILFVDDKDNLYGDPMQKGMEAGALKKILINEGTGKKNAGKIVSSGYPIGFTEVGYNPVELAILESELHDLRFFCNLFGGVPSQLLNDPENKVYNNTKEGEIAFTIRTVFPLLVSFRNEINRKLESGDWGNYEGYYVDFDQTAFTELEENMKSKIEWVVKIPGISPNEVRTLLNLETVDNPLFDEPWITPAMGEPLSEWEMNTVDEQFNRDIELQRTRGTSGK